MVWNSLERSKEGAVAECAVDIWMYLWSWSVLLR